MLQDPNVERYVENAIKPLVKEIAKLKLQIEELNKAYAYTMLAVCCVALSNLTIKQVVPLNVNVDVKNGNTQSHTINANVEALAMVGNLKNKS